ncbi:PAS domain-containing protein [Aurantimonas coralicida]|uniref:PAS domain-containing protein n=1 Tax=Aurantimonas coralicida TaxID=182270 RepID=UPI00396AA9E4|nr:PAS domain-containing protein [Aurantimonas coralicida]
MKSEFQVCQQDAASRSGQQQVAALFEQAAAGMAQTDLTGRFIWANDSYCAILGRSREELLQLRIRDVGLARLLWRAFSSFPGRFARRRWGSGSRAMNGA